MRKINIRKSYPPIIKKKRQGISEKYHVVKLNLYEYILRRFQYQKWLGNFSLRLKY